MWEGIRYYTILTLVVLGMFAVIYPIMYWAAGEGMKAALVTGGY